jgi:hypothetical protein
LQLFVAAAAWAILIRAGDIIMVPSAIIIVPELIVELDIMPSFASANPFVKTAAKANDAIILRKPMIPFP